MNSQGLSRDIFKDMSNSKVITWETISKSLNEGHWSGWEVGSGYINDIDFFIRFFGDFFLNEKDKLSLTHDQKKEFFYFIRRECINKIRINEKETQKLTEAKINEVQNLCQVIMDNLDPDSKIRTEISNQEAKEQEEYLKYQVERKRKDEQNLEKLKKLCGEELSEIATFLGAQGTTEKSDGIQKQLVHYANKLKDERITAERMRDLEEILDKVFCKICQKEKKYHRTLGSIENFFNSMMALLKEIPEGKRENIQKILEGAQELGKIVLEKKILDNNFIDCTAIQAEEFLKDQPNGVFFFPPSSQDGFIAVSIKKEEGVVHSRFRKDQIPLNAFINLLPYNILKE